MFDGAKYIVYEGQTGKTILVFPMFEYHKSIAQLLEGKTLYSAGMISSEGKVYGESKDLGLKCGGEWDQAIFDYMFRNLGKLKNG